MLNMTNSANFKIGAPRNTQPLMEPTFLAQTRDKFQKNFDVLQSSKKGNILKEESYKDISPPLTKRRIIKSKNNNNRYKSTN